MGTLEDLRQSLPDTARDIKVNLSNVLQPGLLTADQRWGAAIAAAYTSRHPALVEAVLGAASAEASFAAIEDARAAATLMAMNNVFYRFRHVIEKPSYEQKPARLRMQRLAATAGPKVDFELFSLVASAINHCEACVRSHEVAVLAGGLTEDQVHEAIRIASVIHAAAVGLETVPLVVPRAA